ncbi:MAG TPA: Pvc16 family protein [Dehalococcoidia bacterium]|nr:Pvc16 family protein [Dehalococcoidia bacterium]
MLNELDETLKLLLQQDLPRVVERIEPDGFDISFDVPNREFRSRLTRPTLCLYLYNIQENRELRGRTWNVTRGPGSVTTRRPAVRLDCSYMVTAWSNEVEDEHRLLTGAARVLFRNPVLPREVLQGGLAVEYDNGIDITTQVAQPETFKDVVDIWSVLDNDLHPSVRVTVTIPLEVDVSYESPAVRERGVGMSGPGWTPPDTSRKRYEGRIERDGRPVAGALVRADTASDRTNEKGEFALENVKPGKQRVFVLVENEYFELTADLPAESVLSLPGADGKANGNGARKDPAPGAGEEQAEPTDKEPRSRRRRG